MHAIDTSVVRFTMVFCDTCIVVNSKLNSEVLRVPRLDHPDYPSHKRLSSISRDELASLFCENAILWGGTLNFSTTKFFKGPWFPNMVMTFVLTPWSHYNTISERHAGFLISLMEGFSIDFPSHMIKSIIDCYHNTFTCDKLIFPMAITRILTHLQITIPLTPYFYIMGAISKGSIRRSVAQLAAKPQVEPFDVAPAYPVASSSLPSSSSAPFSFSQAVVSPSEIMEQL